MSPLSRLAREPLVHFLLIGALLFAWYAFGGRDAGPESRRIVVSTAQVEHLAAGFARTWQRPPTATELKGLIDDYVREEIAVREAGAMGLDRDDTVIRRRLRQKLEFITQDVIDSRPASHEELEAWYREHIDAYTAEPRVALEQVFVNRDRRGSGAKEYANGLLEQLRGASDIDAEAFGDPTMLPASVSLAGRSDIARTFGEEFVNQVMTLEPGTWNGPIESGFGLHLVRISASVPARPLGFDAVAPLVERDFLADRRRREMDAFYDHLLTNYRVELDFETDATAGGGDSVATTEAAGANGR